MKAKDERSKVSAYWNGTLGGLLSDGWRVSYTAGTGHKSGAAAGVYSEDRKEGAHRIYGAYFWLRLGTRHTFGPLESSRNPGRLIMVPTRGQRMSTEYVKIKIKTWSLLRDPNVGRGCRTPGHSYRRHPGDAGHRSPTHRLPGSSTEGSQPRQGQPPTAAD